MSVTEISAAGDKTKTMSSSRLGGAWPLIAIGVAVAANAAAVPDVAMTFLTLADVIR